MKGKKNLLILFSCVLVIIIAGLFACTRSAKEIIPSSNTLLTSMPIRAVSFLNLLPYGLS